MAKVGWARLASVVDGKPGLDQSGWEGYRKGRVMLTPFMRVVGLELGSHACKHLTD